MGISIREHCIPASDEIVRIGRVKELPSELQEMEQVTAGGVIKKLNAIVNSDYFNSLPEYATIVSGMDNNYKWVKKSVISENNRIQSECHKYL